MRHRIAIALVLAFTVSGSSSLLPLEPADPELIPEARALLDYLESVHGKKCLVGQSGHENARTAREASGKSPAILALDLSGWSKTRWDETYERNLERTIEHLEAFAKNGGIVSVQWHWANPLTPEGTYAATKREHAPIDVGKVVKEGTREHEAAMEDLRRHADYLERLAKRRIPVLWRPLHEIDGGWFWWTDCEEPENTAALWRMLFDYLARERGIHNLVWVYSAGLKVCSAGKDVESIDYRKRFYPGEAYVDISGIDIYPNDYFGWPDYRDSAYERAHDIMRRVTPGKMLALCECQGIPNPDILAKDGPRWLWVLPWWAGNERHPVEWVRKTYPHEVLVTLDELPERR